MYSISNWFILDYIISNYHILDYSIICIIIISIIIVIIIIIISIISISSSSSSNSSGSSSIVVSGRLTGHLPEEPLQALGAQAGVGGQEALHNMIFY